MLSPPLRCLTTAHNTCTRRIILLTFALATAQATDAIPLQCGDFCSASIIPVSGDKPLDIGIGDFDCDGFDDIVTINQNPGGMSVFFGNADGIGPETSKNITSRPGLFVYVGDIDNDGCGDIIGLFSASGGNKVFVALHWNGIDFDTVDLPGRPGVASAAIGDANNDGLNEVVISNVADDPKTLILEVSFDTDSFNILYELDGGGGGVNIKDINNDQFNDILFDANGNNAEGFHWNDTTQDYDAVAPFNIGGVLHRYSVGDATNDGYNDIVSSPPNADFVRVIRWDNDLGVFHSGDPIEVPVGEWPKGVIILDVDEDGDNDMLVANNRPEGGNYTSFLRWDAALGTWEPERDIVSSMGVRDRMPVTQRTQSHCYQYAD